MEFISGDDLLRAGDQPLPVDSVTVTVNGSQKKVCCQGLSAINRTRYERSFLRQSGEKVDRNKVLHARGMLIALCVIKGPKSPDDDESAWDRTLLHHTNQAEQLGKMPAQMMEPIYDLCRKLSGIGEKDLEELEQLSAGADGSASATS